MNGGTRDCGTARSCHGGASRPRNIYARQRWCGEQRTQTHYCRKLPNIHPNVSSESFFKRLLKEQSNWDGFYVWGSLLPTKNTQDRTPKYMFERVIGMIPVLALHRVPPASLNPRGKRLQYRVL